MFVFCTVARFLNQHFPSVKDRLSGETTVSLTQLVIHSFIISVLTAGIFLLKNNVVFRVNKVFSFSI